jgi:MoaA/NifB/PqqE/SkfB family radical SAM enzyme
MINYKRVFTGSVCNNNCLVCDFATKPKEGREVSEIEKELTRSDGYTSVELIGGEPTIRYDFEHILKFARDNFRRVKLVTNGRILADWQKARQLVEQGLHIFEIKLCGHNPLVHEQITRSEGSFNQTVQAIANLKSINILSDQQTPFVAIRVYICQGNYRDLAAITRFVISLRVDRIIFSLADPTLTFSELAPHLKGAIETSLLNKLWAVTERIPLCQMIDFEPHVSELYVKLPYEMQQPPVCKSCVYQSVCPGITVAYFDEQGEKELQPVKSSKYIEDMRALQDEKY